MGAAGRTEGTRTGWSVVVTGTARLVTDPAQLTRYEQMLLLCVDEPMDCVIRIQTQLVTGYRLNHTTNAHTAANPSPAVTIGSVRPQ